MYVCQCEFHFQLQVMADDLTIEQNGSDKRQTVKVLHIFMHPRYDYGTAANDIAVLKTGTFRLTETLRVAKLAMDTDRPRVGQNCVLAGWGSEKDGSAKPSPMLFKANLTITDTTQCNTAYSNLVSREMFCARGNGQDACQGAN